MSYTLALGGQPGDRPSDHVVVDEDQPRLVILVNDDVKMSRGKRCAQAVHAALMALGVHPGCPVIVLGGSAKEISDCPVQVNDAGWTELDPGTLTAGVREAPGLPRTLTFVAAVAAVADCRDHLVGTVPDGEGFYTAVCSRGDYRSNPYRSPSTALYGGLMHAKSKEGLGSANPDRLRDSPADQP